MGLQKLSFKVSSLDVNKRLDNFLAETLPNKINTPLSKAKIRKLIIAGAVYLNRHRVRIASKNLIANAQIEVYLDLAKLEQGYSPTQDKEFVMKKEHILFEDEYLILVDKPAGLPTQPTVDEARNNLFLAIKKFLASRDKIVDPYLGIHQRLDRDTSGVILFTKNTKANPPIAEAFSQHQIFKVYKAIVSKPNITPQVEWTIQNYLGQTRVNKGKQAKYLSVNEGGSFAHTDFTLLEILKNSLLVEARPKTGRTHQIRVHLSEMGMPILGDTLYNEKKDKSVSRLMLHAFSLTFIHPISKTEMTISSPLPKDFKDFLQKYR